MYTKSNCLIAQSGGPTAVINSSLYGAIMEASRSEKIDKVYGGINGIEGIIKGNIIDIFDIPYERIKQMRFSPAAALGSCRYRLKDYLEDEEEYKKLIEIFKKYNIKYFFYIGGNDSMDAVDKISKYAREIGFEINVIGIPKTIDNDLMFTDHSPGFGSAAKYIATTTLELALDAEVYETKTINVLEVMGRNAGWLTASSALVKERLPHLKQLIYLPEIPFNEERFLEDVNKAYKEYGNVFITVSEGLMDEKGNYIGRKENAYHKDAFGHPQLGGVGDYIEKLVKEKIYKRVKMTRLGVTQRCAMHLASKVDFEEAEMLGKEAVKYALFGETGKMISLVRERNYPYTVKTDIVDVDKVCNKEKKMPLNWINEEGNYVTEEFFDYARPLIQGEVKVPMAEGLPYYINLKYAIKKQE
ncbi:6-phosphofructokinase [Thermoanaerobacter brockii subsp. lactiethylicus]|uniref:Pyrophosphate--fructose 6-phosphate 1-phosphotransferase n=2 Tax=Thermoanaerobacter TaxID=1754 RepID=B0KD62_THEP3|nr:MULTISPECIES: 6-phosphofructokinase [Thermoanaerobacter]ABY94160.1 phosphofructokinase [Thermoanaerobacter pseudethanolicus ATCC 33223]ADV79113.1 phosphofructokinase [Thermoanaerobacter brockii subsp. finnii Ako-1]MBZ4655817.1 phosphofructokinase [Thermoanaerobacter sp.]HBW60236.1 6-phosphofructokinase [Thermoanaerobacter sp.]